MQTLNYRSPSQQSEEPQLRFPNLLRSVVMLTAAVEMIMAVNQFYFHVKHFNPNSPIAPGQYSDARGFIALTLFILAMAAFLVAQFRDPQVWHAVAYMCFNFIGIPFQFAHYLGQSLAGRNPSIAWTLGAAGWLTGVGVLAAIYAYRLRKFELAGAKAILSEITSTSSGQVRSIESSTTRTTVTIVKRS